MDRPGGAAGVERTDPGTGAPDAGQGTGAGRRARPVVVVALLLALALAAGWLGWQRWRPLQRACTLTAALDTPVASSPEGAFDAWWSTQAATSFWPGVPEGVRPRSADEFTRTSDTTWEWSYADRRSVLVSVARGGTSEGRLRPDTGWAVAGVNGCGYAPPGGW